MFENPAKGRIHGIKARQELNVEGYSFEKVSRHVYVGLTDEEALWLSSRHNANGHFHHNMTHCDYVSSSDSHSNSFELSVTVIILYTLGASKLFQIEVSVQPTHSPIPKLSHACVYLL